MPDTPEPRLAGRELDEAVAELIEPKPPAVSLRDLRPGVDWQYNYSYATSPGGMWEANVGFDVGDDNALAEWFPVEDLIQTHSDDLEAEIARRGLQAAYLNELAEVVNGTRYRLGPIELFALVTAGPEARARAALRAVRGWKG